jgi:hypothetical protein
MDGLNNAANQIIEGLHTLAKLGTGIVGSFAVLTLVMVAFLFMKKDQRGDEEGKAGIMRAAKGLAVAFGAMTLVTAFTQWLGSVLGW